MLNAKRLLSWFRRHARDLPWRATRDPYAIWISEVMLQQTQVATVVPYFLRFLDRFPDVAALARADLHDVLRLWEGLGYYRRARDLHRAAQLVVEQHAGVFPRDVDAAQALPGLGRYTANAVLSQAFDARLPILEANSIRVLCRVEGIRDDPNQSATRKRLWQIAEDVLPAKHVGDFNQALMELGALVCTPQSPRCEACPLAAQCEAHRLHLQADIPLRRRRPDVERVREVAVVVRKGGKVLLVQRPATGRWAHLWEFPHRTIASDSTAAECARALCADLGLRVQLGSEIATLRHGVTRFHIELACLEARFVAGRFCAPEYDAHVWLAPKQLADYPVSRPQRRLAERLSE
jgi:A/G-specific adenine glycosylase